MFGLRAVGLGLAALGAQAAALLAVPALAVAAPPAAAAPAAPTAPYVIVYKNSVSSPGNATAELHNTASVNPGLTYASAFKGFAASLTGAQLAVVQSDPDVAYVEPTSPSPRPACRRWPRARPSRSGSGGSVPAP